MENNYSTERLFLSKISKEDSEFIFELVNTEEWITFIGYRNIKTLDDAEKYIKKLIENPEINYWVVRLKTNNSSIGIITLLKKDYLDHHDIGFAFLNRFTKKGYAFEAASMVLNDALIHKKHLKIYATTVKENLASIKLIEKLRLRFEKELQIENDLLLVYG